MAINQYLVSLHGRKMGQTSSGGIVIQPTSSTGMSHLAEISSAGVFNSSISSFNSTITEMEVAKQKVTFETISSSAATLLNYGVSVISSDVINVSVLKVPAPEAGLLKTIWGQTSASTISFNTTADTILFDATFGASSSALVWDRAGGQRGAYIKLLGLSATRWAVLYKTAVS